MLTFTSGGAMKLQMKQREELLNVIDEIRSQGIDRYIDLPQMIVVGDQSSGKSSVLEAISGIAFPVKDKLCTQFATELILRRSFSETATVSLVAGENATSSRVKAIEAFGAREVDFNQFSQLYNEAKTAMGIDTRQRFSKDVLRIEICGPNQPHLTLIDLPGLFHANDTDEETSDDKYVEELVLSYMKKPRTIILAVFSAKNDFALQIAAKHTKTIDPHGSRVLGVITKPDTVPVGSESEQVWISTAKNKRVTYRLGWHVVRNRDYPERDFTADMRNETEAKFFASGAWNSLPTRQRGIPSLCNRLTTVLNDQIRLELPGFLEEVNSEIRLCRAGLSKLGGKRTAMFEQYNYLHKISHSFSALAKAAIDGHYTHEFFGDPLHIEGQQKRLRAVVQNTLISHVKTIRRRGREMIILEDGEESPVGTISTLVSRDDHSDGMLKEQKELHGCRVIDRKQYIDEIVLPTLRNSRGCELPGTFNPLIIGDIFHRQAASWRSIVEKCADQLLTAARTTVILILQYTADDTTLAGVLFHIIDPAMEKLKLNLYKLVDDVLTPHEQGHPITYNHYFTDTVQRVQRERQKKELEKVLAGFFGGHGTFLNSHQPGFSRGDLIEKILKNTESDMDRFACSQILDFVEAYYKVAQKTMTDNFSVLAIEKCLIQELPKIFSPDIIASLNKSTIQDIAAESEESKSERERLNAKLGILEKTLDSLHRLDRYKPLGIETAPLTAPKILNNEKSASTEDDEDAEAPPTPEEEELHPPIPVPPPPPTEDPAMTQKPDEAELRLAEERDECAARSKKGKKGKKVNKIAFTVEPTRIEEYAMI